MQYKHVAQIAYSGACIVISCLIAPIGLAQTRFEIPDTIPNYATYKYVDECLTAVVRLDKQTTIKDTIWRDTVEVDVRVTQRRVAPVAIAHGRSCLLNVNVDTISPTFREFDLLGRVLLMVERDDDVNRLIHRAFNAAKNGSEWTQAYGLAVGLYLQARPIRVAGLQQLLQLTSPYETPKEAKARHLSTRMEVAISALTLGDTVLPREIVTDVLKQLKANEIDKKAAALSSQLFPVAADVLLNQGMDSLKVSTSAYRNFLESLWSQITDEPFVGSREAVGEMAPPISGKYWYRSGRGVDSTGKGRTIDLANRVDPQPVPIPGKVNVILFLGGGCHSAKQELVTGRARHAAGYDCWASAALAKRLKRQFPALEVVVVSKTFGSFGGGLPVAADDEAKILSNYVLGFLQVPAIQTIAETEFIRMPGLDRRRLDIPLAFEDNYRGIGLSGIILVDERGQIFHNVTLMPSLNRMEVTIRKKLQAVFSRTQNES